MMKKNSSITRLGIFGLIIILILLLNYRFGWTAWFSDTANLQGIKGMVNDNLPLAFGIYCVVTIFACVVLALPGITFALFAGMLFGPVLGTFACLFACTIGASLAFLVSRFFLKDAVKPMLEKNGILKKLLFSGNRKNDLIVLMITRLVPLFPYNLQNFAYGITDISFWSYTAYTFIFMFPGVALYVIGAAGLTAEGNRWMYFLTAGVLAILVTLFGMLIRKKYLPEEVAEETEQKRRNAYIIMTRVPQDGKTKTRLLSVLKPEECRELHEAFLSDMAENLHPEDADIFISYLDDCPDAAERIQDFFPLAAGYLPQRGETLGDKMLDAFETVLASGYERAVLTGTDLPELSNEILNDAFLALRDHDLVLNETTDHGYYLVGMKKTQNIFHIDVYGSGEVFEKTLKNAVDLGLKIYCGKMLMDIDTREDLHAAKAAYECGDFSLWKHTAAFCEKYKEK